MDVETDTDPYENNGDGRWQKIGVGSHGDYPLDSTGHGYECKGIS